MLTTPKTNRYRRARAGGFTLVELMAVMLILVILMTFVIGGSRILFDDVYVKETKNTMSIVMSAITQYHDKTKNYPSQGGNWVSQLVSVKESRAQIEKLDDKTWSAANKDEILDAWGRPIEYTKAGGRGGTPDLISGGPDGDIDTEKDNVRYNK